MVNEENRGKLLYKSKNDFDRNDKINKSLMFILLIISVLVLFILIIHIFVIQNIFTYSMSTILSSLFVISMCVFLAIFSGVRVFETKSISVYSNGILLSSPKYLFIQRDKTGRMIVDLKFHFFYGFRPFIFYNQIEKITYQKNMKSKEIEITLSNYKSEKNKIPLKIMFISIYTKNKTNYILYQILIKDLNLNKILIAACNYFLLIN